MDAFVTVEKDINIRVKPVARDLAINLHKLVSEMANRNAELVDVQFLISYLRRYI